MEFSMLKPIKLTALFDDEMDEEEREQLAKNRSTLMVYVYDYQAMLSRCLVIKEELMKNRFHPRHLLKFRDWRIDGFDSDSDSDIDIDSDGEL